MRNLLLLTALGAMMALLAAPGRSDEAAPRIAGAWTGTWGPLTAEGRALAGKQLDCKVVRRKDGQWQATFEGECGRPYKYTIKMLGRQAGKAVLFKGTVDLGAKDGGVYDWIGRADSERFVGFYTSQGHAGSFRLARPKKG